MDVCLQDYIRYDFDADLQRFKHCQNKSRSFENMVMSYFQRIRPDCRNESLYETGTQKKIDYFNADVFCRHCNTVFEAMGFLKSLLSLSRGTTCSNCRRYSTWKKTGKWMKCGNSILRNVTLLSKCGNVNGGSST